MHLYVLSSFQSQRAPGMHFSLCFSVPKHLQVAKAISKLRLLERGLLDEAKALDDINFSEGPSKAGEDQKEELGEDATVAKILLYAEVCSYQAPHAKRGDYKDGSVFQARKAAIEEFMAIALGSSKKCQRKGCGA
jgi:hypothetical protein